MTAEERRRKLPGAIVKWYEIAQESRVACVVSGLGNSRLIAEALEENGGYVKRLRLEKLDGGVNHCASICGDADSEAYDIIIAVDVIEYAKNPVNVLTHIRELLKPNGRLLLAADNRSGLRYFCGDQDAFSGKVYDSIEDYRHLLPWEREEMVGRAYAKAELVGILEEAGFWRRRFFSVFPQISNPACGFWKRSPPGRSFRSCFWRKIICLMRRWTFGFFPNITIPILYSCVRKSCIRR